MTKHLTTTPLGYRPSAPNQFESVIHAAWGSDPLAVEEALIDWTATCCARIMEHDAAECFENWSSAASLARKAVEVFAHYAEHEAGSFALTTALRDLFAQHNASVD